MAKSLSIKYYDGEHIPNNILREIWELRVGLLTLTKSEQEDWQYFSSFVKREDTALLTFTDKNGAIQGFFTVAFLPVSYDERKGLLMYSKYFYFKKAFRGHYKTMIAPWVLIPKTISKYGLRHLYFVTTSFPQSYISLSKTSGNVKSMKDDYISDWEFKALKEFTLTYFKKDWNEAEGVIENQNIVDPPTLKMSEESKRLHQKFENQNPKWKAGKSLPIIFGVNQILVYTSFKRTLRRLLR